MKNLKAKLRKSGGFTLIEMLIVVAIIAILIAVSIPMVNSALEKSRHAVDQANNRDAAALGAIMYLTDEKVAKDGGKFNYVVNNAHQGKLIAETEEGYTQVKPACSCGATGALTVTITKEGAVSTNWSFGTDGKTVVAP